MKYSPPAHTSDKTQPCDVVSFAYFKKALNETLHDLSTDGKLDDLNNFDFCSAMTREFKSSFFHRNLVASFRSSGLWPVYPARLLSVLLSRFEGNVSSILTADELDILMEKKRVSFWMVLSESRRYYIHLIF